MSLRADSGTKIKADKVLMFIIAWANFSYSRLINSLGCLFHSILTTVPEAKVSLSFYQGEA